VEEHLACLTPASVTCCPASTQSFTIDVLRFGRKIRSTLATVSIWPSYGHDAQRRPSRPSLGVIQKQGQDAMGDRRIPQQSRILVITKESISICHFEWSKHLVGLTSCVKGAPKSS
jgi:hypothetical protein